MSALPEKSHTAAPLDDFDDLDDANAPTGQAASMIDVADVPVRISAVLGKVRLAVADLKALASGSVIELDRRVGDPIDLYVNDKLVARGELVMVDGALGVAMTEVVRSDQK